MCRKIFALIGLFVALTTAAALAQEQPTYEGRGYGGPLGVGPNFQQGGQWGPPVYGQGQSKSVERYRAPQHIDRVATQAQQRRRQREDGEEDAGAGGVESGQVAERELEHRHHRLRSGQDHAGDRAEEDRPCEVGQVEVQQ